MTIALGILASDGVAVAADAQETFGEHKGFALKVHSSMTQTSPASTVNSAIVVTGAGSADYLDALSQQIIDGFHEHQDSDIQSCEAHLREAVEQFHTKYVTPLPAHLAREVWVVVGAQVENRSGLWKSDVAILRPPSGFAAVGSGQTYARMAIEHRSADLPVETAAILAVWGVMEARNFDLYCGRSTALTFLKQNLAYTVPPYSIKKIEGLHEEYSGIEQSALLYAVGQRRADDAKRPRKISGWLRKLRGKFSDVSAELTKLKP